MSPRPENEPDENEPDEDESPGTKTHHRSKTSSVPSSSATMGGDTPASGTGTISSPSADNGNSVPTSTVAPLVVALIVIVVLVTCCILYCGRIRKRINNEQRTQSINGWTSFLTRLQTPQKQSHQQDEVGDPEMMTVPTPAAMNHADPAAAHRQYIMTKPPPLQPIENGSMLQNESSALIRLSAGWPYGNDSNKHESLATPEDTFHPGPAPLPEQLYPHDKIAEVHSSSVAKIKLMKPDEKDI